MASHSTRELSLTMLFLEGLIPTLHANQAPTQLHRSQDPVLVAVSGHTPAGPAPWKQRREFS